MLYILIIYCYILYRFLYILEKVFNDIFFHNFKNVIKKSVYV